MSGSPKAQKPIRQSHKPEITRYGRLKLIINNQALQVVTSFAPLRDLSRALSDFHLGNQKVTLKKLENDHLQICYLGQLFQICFHVF